MRVNCITCKMGSDYTERELLKGTRCPHCASFVVLGPSRLVSFREREEHQAVRAAAHLGGDGSAKE